MKGISSGVGGTDGSLYVPIALEGDEIRLHYLRFPRTINDEQLRAQTEAVLDAFDVITGMMATSQGIDLEHSQCHSALVELARWGSRAYNELFNEQAQEVLKAYLAHSPADEPAQRPTFVARESLFPWELLYDGATYQDGDPGSFWGFGMAPARVLDMQRDNFVHHQREQSPPSDMLFCLHHLLREAHETEWPEIEKLVQLTGAGHFSLLKEITGAEDAGALALIDGQSLLKYIEGSAHNMLHFACHCRQRKGGNDELEVSLVAGDLTAPSKTITIETYTFTDMGGGKFVRKPLVFLNACQAAGGPDSVRKVFNLPQKFYTSGAGAVIATACPVPDRFAAVFALQFYKFFLGEPGLRIAEALRRTRLHFLNAHNNPLGLAYGLYTPAHYSIAEAPALAGGSS